MDLHGYGPVGSTEFRFNADLENSSKVVGKKGNLLHQQKTEEQRFHDGKLVSVLVR
jgi:hypothetical protein